MLTFALRPHLFPSMLVLFAVDLRQLLWGLAIERREYALRQHFGLLRSCLLLTVVALDLLPRIIIVRRLP